MFGDRAFQHSTSTGTGTIDLGTVPAGRQSLVAAAGGGTEVLYVIEDANGSDWEIGLGTLTDASPDTLSRDTIRASTNAGSAISLTSGTHDVYIATDATWLNKVLGTDDKATTVQAEAGTDDAAYMTPAKTVDHLDQYGPRAGLRNAIINGDFRINRRGVSTGSALSLSDGEYFFDRWRSVGATTGIQVATDGTVTLGANEGIEQVVEGRGSDNDNFAVNGDSVTVSVDTPAGNLTVTLLDYSETDTASGTISSGSGRKGVTLTVPALDADGHMIVKIEDASGASNTFKEVQIEKGTIATPFERRPIGTELALAQRYYQTLANGFSGVGDGTTTIHFEINFPVMRATPSLSLEDTSIRVFPGGSNVTSSSSSFVSSEGGDRGFRIAIDGWTGLTEGQMYVLNQPNDWLSLDAEL